MEEPVFLWWENYILKKHKSDLDKVRSKYFNITRKYDINLPKSVKKSQELDNKNGNTLWIDSVDK